MHLRLWLVCTMQVACGGVHRAQSSACPEWSTGAAYLATVAQDIDRFEGSTTSAVHVDVRASDHAEWPARRRSSANRVTLVDPSGERDSQTRVRSYGVHFIGVRQGEYELHTEVLGMPMVIPISVDPSRLPGRRKSGMHLSVRITAHRDFRASCPVIAHDRFPYSRSLFDDDDAAQFLHQPRTVTKIF